MPARSSQWEGRISTATTISNQIKVALFDARANQISYEALSAEAVRVALWALSTHMPSLPLSQVPVSTRRLLDQARVFWQPLSDAYVESKKERLLQPEVDRELLDTLEEQGDVLSFTGGFWLPSPLRLVSLTANHYLLVGGIPAYLLSASIQNALHFHGSFRQIEGKATSTFQEGMESFISWQFQSLDSWLGPFPPMLDDLVRSFDMQELYSVAHQSDSSLEAYVVDDDEPQYIRWQALSYVNDGRYLLRTNTPWGIRQYSIGTIRNRRLTHQSSELHDTDIRRLCYALDQRAGKPTWARWNAQRGELILMSELPGRERKFLSSVGTLQENRDGYYPRRWKVHPQFASSVEEMLAHLGIQIKQM